MKYYGFGKASLNRYRIIFGKKAIDIDYYKGKLYFTIITEDQIPFIRFDYFIGLIIIE